MACRFHSQIPARLLITKKDKTSSVFVKIAAIADAAGPSLCEALLGLHAFTGCNLTSTFAGRGKKYPLKLRQTDTAACQTMESLGLVI